MVFDAADKVETGDTVGLNATGGLRRRCRQRRHGNGMSFPEIGETAEDYDDVDAWPSNDVIRDETCGPVVDE